MQRGIQPGIGACGAVRARFSPMVIPCRHHYRERRPMPIKPNYSFEKRQRELEKKKKKQEKAQRKANGQSEPETSADDAAPSDAAGEGEAAPAEDGNPPA